MNRPTVHLCVATGQNIPNLIAALQLGATRVIIFETKDMHGQASNLKRALCAHGIEVDCVPFDDNTPEATRKSAESAAVKYGEQAIVLNATGGHKLMTLALASEMKLADHLHLLYVETRHNRLDWLQPAPETEPMDNVLSLDDVLMVQGYERVSDNRRDVSWQSRAQERGEVTRKMGDGADELGPFFGVLNNLAGKAIDGDNNAFRPQQRLDYAPGGQAPGLLRAAANHNLLAWDNKTEIVFQSREAAAYFHGGWLEEYAWLKLSGIKPKDWAVNLRVRELASGAENECDIAVVHANRLLIIECKTGAFGRRDAKDADIVYKLSQLSGKLGGSLGKKLLLSARSIKDAVRDRARSYGVDIMAGDEVKRLVAYLSAWATPE